MAIALQESGSILLKPGAVELFGGYSEPCDETPDSLVNNLGYYDRLIIVPSTYCSGGFSGGAIDCPPCISNGRVMRDWFVRSKDSTKSRPTTLCLYPIWLNLSQRHLGAVGGGEEETCSFYTHLISHCLHLSPINSLK